MYCKYCGSGIASDATKCISCGANIDLNDGGQSFFDDDELNAWQSDIVLYNARTSVPKTEMREPLPQQMAGFEKGYNKAFSKPQAGVVGHRSQTRAKSKKNVLDYLNLSSSNKLIIFCIASALAIVLLVVAIIAVFNSGNDDAEETATQSSTSGYTQPVDNNTENEISVADMTEIKDIKIFDKNKKVISHPVSGFIDSNNTLYVSLDRVLMHQGYKNGVPDDNNRNRVIYEHKTSGKVIEIEKETKKIWITESGRTPVTRYLASKNFNVKADTYVPIKSFLGELGYDKDKVKWEPENKTLYFCK